MSTLTLRSYSGEIPRQPTDRLPAGAAQFAENCDFSHGELRPLKGLGTVYACEVAAQPVRGLFTDDGARFLAWNRPTRAYLSPTIDDIYNRIYFMNATDGFRVCQTDQMQQFDATPGPPAVSWAVGVKPPTSISVGTGAATDWAGDPDAELTIKILCKQGAATIKTTDAAFVTTEELWQSYVVTVPDGTCSGSSGGTPIGEDEFGFVQVPVAAFAAVTWAESDGGIEWHPVSGTLEFGANWYLDVHGNMFQSDHPPNQTYASSALNFAAVAWQRYAATVIWYQGTAWDPTALFNALKTGTAGSSTALETTTAFQVIISNPTTGVTYLDQEVSGEALGGGDFRVVIPQTLTDGETVAYTAVAVNIWGEESANVLPVLVQRGEGEQVTVTVTHTPDGDQAAFAGINFYRTYASNQSADYILINTTPVTTPGSGTYTFVDATIEPPTTTVLQSTDWDEPPDGLENLTYVGNGVFAASLDKDLLLSEPYHPHAWPYRMTFAHLVVGIVAIEGGILVTTTAQPYMVSGGHPDQMSQQLLAAEQAGWSDTSMARVDGQAVYASNDGLVGTFGGLPKLSTLPLFTRADWRARFQVVKRNLRLSQHDGRVVGIIDPSYPAAATADNFLLHLDESENAGFCRLDAGQALYGAWVAENVDKLYVGTATGFAEFAAGSDLTYEWKSGEALHPGPVAFSCGMVDCVGTTTLEVYAGGTLLHTVAVSGETFFRLPVVLPNKRWAIRMTGTGIVREASLATSGAELRGV